MTVAALSGALAGPPATASDHDDLGDFTSTELELDAGAVWASGDDLRVSDRVLADIEARLDIEVLTESGRRWGFALTARAEKDSGRLAWGGASGDCPPDLAACLGVFDQGRWHPVRPATSSLTGSAGSNEDDVRFALQRAHVFVHTGWGEWQAGYGFGASDQMAETGPTAFRLSRADGGRIDPTGLSGARTRNLSSGISPKLVFRSVPLGQARTVGRIRVAASLTPRARDCGVDVCHRAYGPADELSPVSDNVIEIGAQYGLQRGDHEWAVSLGLSRGDAGGGQSAFEGIAAEDLGLSWRSGLWSAGARWLRSNNGLSGNFAYQAWSASLGYEQGPWLTVLEYAAFDDNASLTTGQSWQLGASRLVGENWLLGLGIQRLNGRARRNTG